MVRNAQLALTKGQKSVQAFMGWVGSAEIDTHFISLFDTWPDPGVSLCVTELVKLSAMKPRAQQREVIALWRCVPS